VAQQGLHARVEALQEGADVGVASQRVPLPPVDAPRFPGMRP
jgi:hypothetical protein